MIARRTRDYEDEESSSSPFDITRTKDAPIERLKRWRQAALVLNASRRYRYTLDLRKEEEKLNIIRKTRARAEAIQAAMLKEAARRVNGSPESCSVPIRDYAIGSKQLALMTREHDLFALSQYEGGVKGLAVLLGTDLEKGISGDDDDFIKRRNEFGSNTYPRKKGWSFWMFLWEAWQDLTLIFLMIAAVASLALGIKIEGIKEGWYDGGSIALAVILVIVVTAVIDYRQSLQFQNLNEEKRNILLQAIRGGRRVEVSIFDLVVGDVLPLNIGDQVPADGIFISGHSLAIDESIMTGESKIVRKDSNAPFLMSGCKVAVGSGTMLVTSVGTNTEWGLLMASISEDTGEETPLQVRLNGVMTFIGMIVAFAVLVVLLVRYFTGHSKDSNGKVQFTAGKTSVGDAVYGAIKIVTVALTIVVVAVPKGLPLVVTLTLAYSMRKMMADKALVRRLSACETMGAATTICCDKTALNQDPFRPGVKEALRLCQNAGVKVRMVTDDDLETAKAIAFKCGILKSEEEAIEPNLIEGNAFCAQSDEQRKEIADRILVMGRSSPYDKLLLVQALRKGRHVVAVTGDGINDAPELWKEADISLAMGIHATQVVKESSDIIILDDSLATVLKVVRWGRSVYANIQKFIQFKLTVNVAALIINVASAVSSGNVPLNAVQVLWVNNLITDTLGALALATEPPTDHLMHRRPVGQREPLITNIMWRNLLIQAAYQVTVLLILNFRGRSLLGLEHDNRDHAYKVNNTLIFNAFVLCQIFNEFNARKPDEINVLKGITKNRLFMGIVGLTLVLQIIIIEFLGKFTSTVGLNWKQWLVSIAIGFISWPLAVIGKLIPVPETKFFTRFQRPRKLQIAVILMIVLGFGLCQWKT